MYIKVNFLIESQNSLLIYIYLNPILLRTVNNLANGRWKTEHLSLTSNTFSLTSHLLGSLSSTVVPNNDGKWKLPTTEQSN